MYLSARSTFRRRAALLGGIAILATSAPAAAVTVVSNAFGLSVNLNVTPAITASVGPVASTGGTAAPAYSTNVQVASVNQALGLGSSLGLTFGQGVSTGVLVSTASSPFPVTPTGTATSTVNNLALGLTSQAPLAAPLSLLSIGATTLTSTSSVDATGMPTRLGTSSITGLTVSGLALGGLVVNGSLFANAAPNTELINLLGLRIVINEQFGSASPTGAAIATNAIHIGFTNFLLGLNLLNGDIYVAHSDAAITGVQAGTVPEPAVWAQMIAGFALVGLHARRRARRVAA